MHSQLIQPSTPARSAGGFAITHIAFIVFGVRECKHFHTSLPTTKNYKRAWLFATTFLPSLKTNFFRNDSASIERILIC